MNPELDLDRVLASWLAEGDDRAPAADVVAGLRTATRTRQRHGSVARHLRVGLPIVDVRWMAAGVLLATALGAALVVRPGPAAASRSVTPADFPWTAGAPALDAVAFVARVPSDAPEGMYWWAAAYDRFELGGWSQSDVRVVDVPAGAPLPAGTGEDPPGAPTVTLQVTIEPTGYQAPALLSPGRPRAVSVDTSVSLTGDAGSLAAAEVRVPGAYTVDAAVLPVGDGVARNGDQLRRAGQDYPAGIVEQFTEVPRGAMGPDASAMLEAILDSTPERTPYDVAVAVESYLRSDRFAYDTDPGRLSCADPSVVECLARSRAGYCLHFASTMAILLRAALPDDPIPTRLVQGFLPGIRTTGTEAVSESNAHAWVEVFFPGSGWVAFDPTPRGEPVVVPRSGG